MRAFLLAAMVLLCRNGAMPRIDGFRKVLGLSVGERRAIQAGYTQFLLYLCRVQRGTLPSSHVSRGSDDLRSASFCGEAAKLKRSCAAFTLH